MVFLAMHRAKHTDHAPAGLHTEALAMLDMLVLSRAARFTGFHASSFSWYVQEHRCQRGIPVTTTTMPKVTSPRGAAH